MPYVGRINKLVMLHNRIIAGGKKEMGYQAMKRHVIMSRGNY